ncbi:HNH endonuclease signature motif containing protein [Paenibacillus cineris]|uniref:HNH endonuclease signature motif containing protein n=1 Tax=Paenibacillus cineris TaxID=237530 RepID=UPI001B04DED0|nr:HNH endonuclease signature motif containing protein [Paenibacillus cineris]GIO63563.1 hypothetical protein J43TS9_51370 [Paenibacillus cineris]
MKNEYEIRGDVTAVFIKRKGKVIETLIDTEDLKLMEQFKYTWQANWSSHTNSYYIRGYNRTERVALHRYILNYPDGFVVDHINHDTLDNRKCNLRMVTNRQNQLNRKGASKGSKSRIKWIHWDKNKRMWQVRYRDKNGNRVFGGNFKTIEEAETVLKKRLAAES